MFTGIIQDVGKVKDVRSIGGGVALTIHSPSVTGGLAERDSVAINGVCLTVVRRAAETFTVEAVEETLRKTTLGGLRVPARVNLELPMRLGERLGGHLVQGHVDCVGAVRQIEAISSSWLVEVEFPRVFARYVVPHGSIAVDGISLTVARLQESVCVVSIIPYTFEHTTIGEYVAGRKVNLEFDLIGKYIENLMKGEKEESGGGLTSDKLRQWGYGG